MPVIRYRDGTYLFAINDSYGPGLTGAPNGRYDVTMRPGRERQQDVLFGVTWNEVYKAMREWLRLLRAEVESPDLWAELAASRGDLITHVQPPAASDNTPFTPAEQQVLRAELAQLQSYVIATYELTADQTQGIKQDIAYLSERLARLERFDWRALFVSTAVGWLAGQVQLPPDVVRAVVGQLGPYLGELLRGFLPMLRR